MAGDINIKLLKNDLADLSTFTKETLNGTLVQQGLNLSGIIFSVHFLIGFYKFLDLLSNE